MDIIIQSLGFTAGETLEAFVHEKLGELDKEIRIVRANVTLFVGPDADPDRYHCEVRLEIPGNDIFVKKGSDTFDEAIADVANTLQKKVRKAKEKQLERNQGKFP